MALDAFKQEVEAAFEDFKVRFESAKAAVEAELSEQVNKVEEPAPNEGDVAAPDSEPTVAPAVESPAPEVAPATPVEPPVTDENGNPVADPNAAR
jgi:hypothetical protein